MDAWAWVEHPVTGLTARVARTALAHHLSCGWVETAAPEPAAGEPETAGETPEPAPTKTSRRRAGADETGE